MAEWFVDGEFGNDTNSGTSPTSAFKTFTKACSVMQEGDILWIKPGVYYSDIHGSALNIPSNVQWIGDVNGEKWGIKGWVYIYCQDFRFFEFSVPKTNLTFKNLFFVPSIYNLRIFNNMGYINNLYFENCFINYTHSFVYYGGVYNLKFKNCFLYQLGYGENTEFENCIIYPNYPQGTRWGLNYRFKNCYIWGMGYVGNNAEGGYPASMLFDRCIVNTPFAVLRILWGLIVDASKLACSTINSIITNPGLSSNEKVIMANCMYGGSAPSNYTRYNCINKRTFFDIIRKEEIILKSKSLTITPLYKEATIPNIDLSLYKWLYYKPITIQNNDATNYSDIQIKIVVDTASLVSAGKLRSFCEDLRFTLEDGTSIPFWIEYGENTANTIIWVKIPSLPASGSTTIRMYYGNPYMPRRSDGYNTFEFFDDFVYKTDNYNKWHVQTADNTFSETFVAGNEDLYPAWPGELRHNSIGYHQVCSRWKTFTRPIIIEAKCRNTVAWGTYSLGLFYYKKTGVPNINYYSYRSHTDGSNIYLWIHNPDGTTTQFSAPQTLSLDTKYINAIVLRTDTVGTRWYTENRILINGLGDVVHYNNYDNYYVGFDHYVDGVSGRYAYYDWIIVRKYIATEPTISIGNEVSGEFYPEGQPDLKDLYGREPIGVRDIGAIESEYPPETGTVIINMRGGFQR